VRRRLLVDKGCCFEVEYKTETESAQGWAPAREARRLLVEKGCCFEVE